MRGEKKEETQVQAKMHPDKQARQVFKGERGGLKSKSITEHLCKMLQGGLGTGCSPVVQAQGNCAASLSPNTTPHAQVGDAI